MTVTSANGDSRLFVSEKGGVIRAINRQSGESSVFLDISSKVGTDGERGLLGLTFDPNFQNNGRFYVNYSDKTNGNTIIERYQTTPGTPSPGDPASAYRLMTIDQPANETSHKAGWIGFRPNEPNNLYIATGDGAWSPTKADPYGNAQNLNSNLGKILRIDVNTSSVDRNYGIPASNAFVGSGNPEIWAYGLRNPFRNSFDKLTGALYIGDVGFTRLDEVNFLAAGAAAGTNFGWPIREGNLGPSLPGSTDSIFNVPVGSGSALIGGVVYRGPIQSLYGVYFYADFVNQTLKSFRFNPLTGEITDPMDWTFLFSLYAGASISSFGEDYEGNLFMTDFTGGRIFALVPDAVPLPATWLMLLCGFVGFGYFVRRNPKGIPLARI